MSDTDFSPEQAVAVGAMAQKLVHEVMHEDGDGYLLIKLMREAEDPVILRQRIKTILSAGFLFFLIGDREKSMVVNESATLYAARAIGNKLRREIELERMKGGQSAS